MTVFHSCGHKDKYRPVQGWPLILKAYSCGRSDKAVEYSTVCHPCYLRYVGTYPTGILIDTYEIEDYLSEKDEE